MRSQKAEEPLAVFVVLVFEYAILQRYAASIGPQSSVARNPLSLSTLRIMPAAFVQQALYINAY